MSDAIYSPQELIEIRSYVDPIYIAGAVHELLIIGFWVICLRFLVVRFDAWSVATSARIRARFPSVRTPLLDRVWRGSGWGAALLFTLALFASCDLLWTPADLYFGFFRERAFGLSEQSFGRFAWDYFKGFNLNFIGTAAAAIGIVGVAKWLPRWWLIMGVVCAFALTLSAALDPYRAKVFVDQTPLPAGEVRDAITALMHKANIDFKDVVLEKTLSRSVRVQAYFAGKGPTRTIVVNDALLKNLSTDEIVAAIGHEAGHVHESRWAGQVASTLALLGFLFVIELLFRLVARRGWWGVTQRADIRVLPLILAVFGLCHLAIGPFSAAFQRQRERDADQYGLRLTQDVDAFRRMLVKAARVNKMDPDPPTWVVLKGWSHPPIRERLEAVDQWKKTDGG